MVTTMARFGAARCGIRRLYVAVERSSSAFQLMKIPEIPGNRLVSWFCHFCDQNSELQKSSCALSEKMN
jgi:hypothetical protein